MRVLFSNSRFSMAFSLIFAFVFWLVLSIDQNPSRQATLTNVPIDFAVTDSVVGDMGLDIVNENYLKNATVTVQGPNYIVSSLKNTDVRVYADLSEITDAGVYEVPLVAERTSPVSGYGIVAVTPSSVTLTFDYMDTKEFEVQTKADGISAETGLIVDKPTVVTTGSSTVTIRGSKSKMEKIDHVMAIVKETEVLSATKSYDASLTVYDAEGTQLDTTGLTLSTTKVKVSVPICKKKELAVTPTFANEPMVGLGESLVTGLSVTTVTVIGPPTTIDALETVSLAKIDFNQLTPSTTSFNVSFSLPDGVRVLDSLDYVTVNLKMSGYDTDIYTIPKSNIRFEGLGDGLTATAATDLKKVMLCGIRSTLDSVDVNALTATVDLSGKGPGEYTVSVSVDCGSGKPLWIVGTYTVAVTIR